MSGSGSPSRGRGQDPCPGQGQRRGAWRGNAASPGARARAGPAEHAPKRGKDYSKNEKVASSVTDAKQKTNSEQRFTSRWRPLLWALLTDLPKKDKGGEAPGTWGQKGVILIHIFK